MCPSPHSYSCSPFACGLLVWMLQKSFRVLCYKLTLVTGFTRRKRRYQSYEYKWARQEMKLIVWRTSVIGPPSTAATYTGNTRQAFRLHIKRRRSPPASEGEKTWLTCVVKYETRFDFNGICYSRCAINFYRKYTYFKISKIIHKIKLLILFIK
jgi:hypothetical protein